MSLINDLPDVILEFILSKVSLYQDIKCCSLVCQRWRHCCQRVVRRRQSMFSSALLSGPLIHVSLPHACAADSPCTPFIMPRFSHSAVIAENSMFAFGGCTASQTTFNDLCEIDLRTRKKTRVLTKSMSAYPSPKSHAAMVVWRDTLVLFGGWTSPSLFPLHQQGLLFDELHSYSIPEKTWTTLLYENTPPPVAGHTATLHEDVIVFFGGLMRWQDSAHSINSIYCLDMSTGTWYRPAVTREAPAPRYGHTQIKVDERHMLIIAGCGGYNDLHEDMWLLSMPENLRGRDTWVWKLLKVESDEHAPQYLWCNPMCKVEDYVVVLSRTKEPKNTGLKPKAQFIFKSGKHNFECWNAPERQQPETAPPSTDRRRLASTSATPSSPFPPTPGMGSSPTGSSSFSLSNSHPSVRPNASNNRERQLSILSKYESDLRARVRVERALAARSIKPACRQTVYLLSLLRVLSEGVVEWVPGPGWRGSSAPHTRLLSTLLRGRGELIMCGGRMTAECDCRESDSLPDVIYITAPDVLTP